jgi:hypothetical protein
MHDAGCWRILPKIASFLELPDADYYTVHSMRPSSATLLLAGGDITTIKGHDGRKLSTAAKAYIEESE